MSRQVEEEGVVITSYGDKISKELDVFYNPVMKLNRDISMLVIKTYFSNIRTKKIKFCDPMGASGIRELRFLKDIPEIFEKITIGDISSDAIKNIENNFKENKLSMKKIELTRADAINTIASQFYDFIEIDPFGSPVPFIDIAVQRIKHKGILSCTATDTSALCGTYPKTGLRRYGIRIEKTYYYDEIGLRNLISYVQIQTAKYDKCATPIVSYVCDHYYKVFFVIEEGKNNATNSVRDLGYINWDKKTQENIISKYEIENSIGKTFLGPLQNKEFILKLIGNIHLISDQKKILKLLEKLHEEIDYIGYFNPDKLEKEFKFSSRLKYDKIIEKVREEGFEISRVHNNPIGLKTNCSYEKLIEIMKEEENN